MALATNTTGFMNTANGYLALWLNTTGSYNTANGCGALLGNTTGFYNTANGYGALGSNGTGNNNTANGCRALRNNGTGNNNTANGYWANYYNQEGSNNTIIGFEAGRGTTLHNKSGNVFLGYQAGYYDTTDNKLYIENSDTILPLIYGEFDNDILAVNGSLGVGTSSPSEKLEVNGNAKADTVFAEAFSSNSPLHLQTNGTTRIYVDDATGDVGIGNSSPTAKLDVNGTNGYDQLRLRTPYTPTGTSDSNGNTGDISWDEDYIYVKTSSGWKRTALSTFW